jgi:2-(1,2-epoxy-1,2-dihydrophenyl)acetyl-CoA isomerase
MTDGRAPSPSTRSQVPEFAAEYTALDVALADGVLQLTLNRPDSLNALNLQLKGELARAVEEAAIASEVRAVLLTGAGRAFCSGGDITEMDGGRSPVESRRRMRHLLGSIHLPLTKLEKPVVVAVNGHAFGAGLSLALAGDIVLVADDAKLCFAFAKVGLVPDSGALFHLPRLIGLNRAKELVFTARVFTPAEAVELGLVNRAVPSDELQGEARALARSLADGPGVAFGLAKTLLNQSPLMRFEDMIELEAYAVSVATATRDHAEGIAAFLEKRAPVFDGS